MSSSRRVLARQWQIIQYLNANRNGARVSQLEQLTERSRATVYRDLQTLRDAGVPIETENRNGDARYRLMRPTELPALQPSALQLCALHLARTELEPLAGTGLVSELDELLGRFRPPEKQQSFSFAQRPREAGGARGSILRNVERALASRRRVRIDYRAAKRGGKSRTVEVEPLLVKVVRGDAYLRAYCIDEQDERTYKLVRIASLDVLEQRATYVPKDPPERAFERSIKIWRGNPKAVEVRLDPDVAWLASEYPLLHDQRVQPGADGGLVVTANVAGTVEAMRWVLAWGGSAEALAPPELREETRTELEKALAKYQGPKVARARRRPTARGGNRVSRAS